MKKQLYTLGAVICFTTSVFGTIVNQIGTYNGWDSLSWTAIHSLDDPNDGLSKSEIDFVGDASDAGAYWADNGSYVFFRFRVNVATVTATTFRDAHHLLINVDNYKYGTGFGSDDIYPDYSFAWDSKSNDPNAHGFEMTHIAVRNTYWNGVNMDDLDGSASSKGTNDINGEIGSTGTYRDTDGYVRTLDGQVTENLGTTTFIDFAVSWEYLETYTDLAQGQNWSVALGAVSAATDHNNLTGDIGGDANPSDLASSGWAPIGTVPEPATISLIGIAGVVLLIGRRFTKA